jgi:nitrate reductase NapAB chaperone NapD
MHYSGIVVVTDPLRVGDCQRRLESLPGVEVHYCEPQSGRLVVVQETASAEDQERGLRSIQALPDVKVAALVEHRIDVDDEGSPVMAVPSPPEGGETWN